MSKSVMTEAPDSASVFQDAEFHDANKDAADTWVRIADHYPQGKGLASLLPDKLQREQFEQGDHFECFMLTALAVLVNYPEAIRNCFVTKKPRQDGRYTFQFFRYNQWHKVEIDDRIALVEKDTVYIRSPTKHWWPLLIEKAYAKFYKQYSHIEGCTLQEALHDLTGNPVLNIPLDTKLASAAGANIGEGNYWLDLSKKIRTGQMGATALSKREVPQELGLREEQTYGIMEIISMNNGTELVNLLVHIYSPFEEDAYTGPMRDDDPLWTPELRSRYDPSKKNSIFIPLMEFTRVFSSMQQCYLKSVDTSLSLTFEDKWEGESAGGNPMNVSWRKNPLYLVRNTSAEAITIVAEVRQQDQRADADPENDQIKYLQCGLVLSQASFPDATPTMFVTGNNHKSVHKGLFLNSREVANVISIPPESICYLVPTGMQKSVAPFCLGVHKLKGADYSAFSIEKLSINGIAWDKPAADELDLQPKSKDRVDFFIDEASEVHILLTQMKKFTMKSGGDNMTEDFCGMYLYDDSDKKISGVAAATNFREISLIYKCTRMGRYAVSVTCPKGSGEVPITVSIVASPGSNVRIVDPPADAKDFADNSDEDEEAEALVDYEPREYPRPKYAEPADSKTPFEDRQFFIDNKSVTDRPWLHITEIYPEGKSKPLLPETLSTEQFEQGDHFECFMLTALSVLVNHPEIIRNCFLTKKVRQDGRYAFQFFRYGQWHVVEIDDRIPVVEGTDTLYCRSPTKHWWPLLIEKAYAKFYNRYSNIEGCTLQEAMHDMTGNPVMNLPMDPKLAAATGHDIDDPMFWVELNDSLSTVACTALTRKDQAEALGMRDEQTYGILGIIRSKPGTAPSMENLLVHLYNPFIEDVYTGPMNTSDLAWTDSLIMTCPPDKNHIFMQLEDFIKVFASVQICHVSDVISPCFSFHSAWDKDTAGGNPTFVTWRDNPLYVVQNTSDEPVQIFVTIRQPDQRSTLHLKGDEPIKYNQCGMILSQSNYKNPFPTHLVTANNHRAVHKGLFLNSREVSNLVTVPAKSLSYLVPSAMMRQVMGRFMLSYNFLFQADTASLTIRRHRSVMARDKPAVDELELLPRSKDRVDFLVDCPTEVHILLHQAKVFQTKSGGDSMTEDYCGIYLYDDRDQRIAGVAAATNYRDSGLVYVVPRAGRYAISVTCPKGSGKIPITVSVVAKAEANVRITDPPDDAEEFVEVDLSFLDPEPEGVPLDELPLYDDAKFKKLLEELKALQKSGKKDPATQTRIENAMNVRVHELAKLHIAKDRHRFLKVPEGQELATFNPILDDDEPFTSKEVERFALKKDPRNATKVKDVEKQLNERAATVAVEYAKPDRTFLESEVRGVPLADLSIDSDPTIVALDKKLREAKRRKPPNEAEINEIQDEIRRRVDEVADQYITKHRSFLNQEPLHVPLGLLHIDADPTFRSLEKERFKLLKDPKKNAAAIKEIEESMNKRCEGLAKELLERERSKYLEPEYRGIGIQYMDFGNDPKFKELEKARRQAEQAKDQAKVRDLEHQLAERADELAQEQNEKDRAYLDKAPNGVPVAQLPLHSDATFLAGEAKRARLKRDPAGNAEAIKKVEAELNDRAQQLAVEALKNDRAYLEQEHDGIHVRFLPLDSDAQFKSLEAERFKLKSDPSKNAAKIKEKEAQLNARANEMAKEIKAKSRAGLKRLYLGIPVDDLPLDTDKTMKDLENRRRELAKDPSKNKDALAEIDEEMDEHAQRLADELHQAERENLDQEPQGVSLSDLPLNSDKAFLDLENELRRLRKDPSKNAAKIKEKEAQLNARIGELARAEVESSRGFLDPEPEGVPLKSINLDADKPFLSMEAEMWRLRRKHRKDPNHSDIEELKRRLNKRSHELALELVRKDRAYLAKEIEGVPTADLPLDDDPDFRKLEADRARLKADLKKNAKGVADAEDELNKRARQIALDVLDRERKQFDQNPLGVPIRFLPIHSDKPFRQFENDIRKLRKQGQDDDADDLVDKANDRLKQLARECLKKDRAYLEKEPEGVPLSELPLDKDEPFRNLEVKRFVLIKDNAGKPTEQVKELEDRLNERARQLANERIAADRAFLDPEPEGVLLDELPLDSDKQFNDMRKERNRLKRDEAANPAKIGELEAAMNDRCHQLAKEELAKDRKFLKPEHRSVALDDLPFVSDPKFIELERRRRQYRRKNPHDPDIASLEDEMNERLDEIAEDFLDDERAFLEPEPEGVPLSFIPFDSDKGFKDLEKQRRVLRKDKKKNADKIAELETKILERIRELARQYLAKDRAYLEAEPEGIPLGELPLNSDKAFRTKERSRQQLKKSPEKNKDDIEDVEFQLNERARELAMEQFEKDRAYLEPEPEGVPIAMLPLNFDKPFREIEIQRRRLKKDVKKNGDRIKECEDKLNARARELAREQLSNDRGFLDPEPEGVLLEYLPLNQDKTFRELEKERSRLKRDMSKNADAVDDLETKLNDRAKVMARDLITKERAQFLKPEHATVPVEFLPIDGDSSFREMEKRRRSLKRSGSDGAQINALDDDLNDRALDLAHEFLAEERAFLDRCPEGIPIEELPLTADKTFRDMELDRRRLRKDASSRKKFAGKIQELEDKLQERARELARKLINDERSFLNPMPHGVLLEYLPLDTDDDFKEMESDRRRIKRERPDDAMKVKELEDRLNDRAHFLAKEYLAHEREYLDPCPEGVPIAEVPIDNDKPFRAMELERRKWRKEAKNGKKVKELEGGLNERARQLARELRGYQDPEFHNDNEHVAPKWMRISELIPEGQNDNLLPERPSGADVESGPDGSGFLAPYLAALTRNLAFYHKLVETKLPSRRDPFVFNFHSHVNGPTRIEVDDRIPVGADGLPAFTRASNRHWYPMLIEKAYAKFRGGYKKLDHVTPHEVLRELTGRPVSHVPLEAKLAKAAGIGDYTHPKFWRGIGSDIARGDIVTAMSIWEAPDGVHRQSSYAIMTVVETVEGSDDPNNTFVRLHNSYRYAPYYHGPMHKDDPKWTEDLLQLCKYDRSREDTLFLPIPVFIRNFVSLQKCHSNAGDAITHGGEWDTRTSGGNPNNISFRQNPIYVMENKGTRTATVILELRHSTPAEGKGEDDDDEGAPPAKAGNDEPPTYPQTGIVVMVQNAPVPIHSHLITHNLFRFLYKGMILDSREMSCSVEVPATTTCFVIPYTMRRGIYGRFDISLYPFKGKFGFAPLNPNVFIPKPLTMDTGLKSELDGQGRRLDFLMDETSEIHVLVQQTRPFDSGKKGNLHAGNELQVALFDENDKKITHTGDATDFREQAVLSRPCNPGRYAILLLSPRGDPPEFPVTVHVFASKKANLRWTPIPPGARPLVQSRFPALPKSAPVAATKSEAESPPIGDEGEAKRRGSLPPIHKDNSDALVIKVAKEKVFVEVPIAPAKPKAPVKKVFAFGSSSPRQTF